MEFVQISYSCYNYTICDLTCSADLRSTYSIFFFENFIILKVYVYIIGQDKLDVKSLLYSLFSWQIRDAYSQEFTRIKLHRTVAAISVELFSNSVRLVYVVLTRYDTVIYKKWTKAVGELKTVTGLCESCSSSAYSLASRHDWKHGPKFEGEPRIQGELDDQMLPIRSYIFFLRLYVQTLWCSNATCLVVNTGSNFLNESGLYCNIRITSI